jgi:hypothetical protein
MPAASREEFNEWLEHPVTRQLRKKILEDIELMKEMLLNVDTEDLRSLQGRCNACINLYEVEYEALYE